MECKNVYYQGEDIIVRVSGTEKINLEECEWVLAMAKGGEVEMIEKKDSQRVEENCYRIVFGSERTARMSPGIWDVELKVVGGQISIATSRNVLVIKESVFGYDKF